MIIKRISFLNLSITHLGRLMYTTGETEKAIRLFLGLLRGSSAPSASSASSASDIPLGDQIQTDGSVDVDKVFLADFRQAFEVRIFAILLHQSQTMIHDVSLAFHIYSRKRCYPGRS